MICTPVVACMHGGFAESVAEAIANLEKNCPARDTPCPRMRLLLQVAGALLRQLKKELGTEDTRALSDQIVERSFLAELRRVVHGWPDARDFVRPRVFFLAAFEIRQSLSELGACEAPHDPDLDTYADLDSAYPLVITDSLHRLRFASPAAVPLLDSLLVASASHRPSVRRRCVRVLDDDDESSGAMHVFEVIPGSED